MSESPIEWLQMPDGSQGHTWNPVTGCKKIGQGCKGCYAIPQSWMKQHHPNPKIAAKFFNVVHQTGAGLNWTGEIGFSETVLLEPIKRKTPTKYFISLSDLFYDARPYDHLDAVMSVALACSVLDNRQHEIIVLTKYVERAAEYFGSRSPADHLKVWAERGNGLIYLTDENTLFSEAVESATCHRWDSNGTNSSKSEYKPWGYTDKLFPLPSLTLGCSISTQKEADSLIPQLLRIPAARRIVSAEPLIEAVDFTQIPVPPPFACEWCGGFLDPNHDCYEARLGIDGVIVGGESGPGARPCDVAWIRSLVRQCREANVPCFVKQLGADPREGNANANCRNLDCTHPDCAYIRMKLTDKKGGDISEWPEDLRVRQWPEVTHA